MCTVVLAREKEAKKLTNSLLQTTENRPIVETGAMDVLVSADTLRGDDDWEADNNLAGDVVFNCWNCEQEIIANRMLAGRSINCPNCTKTLSIPES